ncbi:MAG: type II toxin-antitoxin system RelE/ParE family toxin [Candidatus Kapaibacterium sp.]
MNFRLTSAAEEEFRDASLFLLEESPQAALSFVDEITESIEEIAEFPYRYAIYEADIRVRRTIVHPYSIFYQILIEHVLILSISHDSREEGYWKDRI